MQANVMTLDGKIMGSMELPNLFSEHVRKDLIQRAVLAENSHKLQPQAHFPLAGMQTTATYYGAMNSYRSGRHRGIAIRPREKLGGGVQGKVRRIPSSVKGKRAHPHLAEKRLVEEINKKEYQKALASAISATSGAKHTGLQLPIVVADEIESIKKTRDMIKVFESLKLKSYLERSHTPHLRSGLRRSSKRRIFKKSVLLIINKDGAALRAARNLPGVDACTISNLSANLLAPGGTPGRITVWSESAMKNIGASIEKHSLRQ